MKKGGLHPVPWKSIDALIVFFVPWIFLPLAAELVVQFLAPSYAPAAQFLRALDQGNVKASFALVVLDAIGSFFLIRYYLRKYHVHVRDLGWRKVNVFKALLYIIGIPIALGILVTIALTIVQALIPSFNANQPQTNDFVQNTAPNLQIYDFLALIIIPPILEETVFRGFMFPAFSKRYGPLVGALLSSALFGFAHLQGNVSIYTFVLGLLLCGVYYRTRSIFPGMAIHMLNNYLAYIAITQK